MHKPSVRWRRLADLALVSGLLLAPSRGHADDAKSALSSEMSIAPQRTTLSNGLTVLLAPDATASRVSLRVSFDLGWKDDPRDMRGMAKLVEKLLADPSTRHVQRDMRQTLFRTLGLDDWKTDVNAAMDHTSVTVTVPPSDVNVAIWLESDRMGFLLDGTDDVVIHEKIASVAPSGWDQSATFHLGRQALFPSDHPYGGDLDRRKLTTSAARAQIRKYLVPRNTVLAIAGPFDPKVVKPQIDDGFGSIADAPKPAATVAPSVEISGEKRVRGEASVAAPCVGMLWVTPPFLGAEDAAFDGLAWILEERLQTKYVEGSKIASLVDAHEASMKLASVFEARMSASPGHTVEEIEDRLAQEIEQLATEGPTTSEATRASRIWLLNRALDFTRMANRAYVMSISTLIKDDPAYYPAWFAAYEGFTADKLKAAAQKYLVKSRRVVVTITPNPQAPPWGRSINGGGV